MPTQKTVNDKLKTLSFPVEFDHVKVGTKVPFGEYTFSVSPVSADDKVLIKGFEYDLNIYVTKLDTKIDAEVEKMFDDLEIVWTRSEPTYIEDSKCYQITYQFGFVGDAA